MIWNMKTPIEEWSMEYEKYVTSLTLLLGMGAPY
jgi:hypothetical protein